jgi:hypothetical protein
VGHECWNADDRVGERKFGEVVDKARLSGPQVITKNGRTAVLCGGVGGAMGAEDPWAQKFGAVLRGGSAQEGWSGRDRPVNFLLDTNVVSEWEHLAPDTGKVG